MSTVETEPAVAPVGSRGLALARALGLQSAGRVLRDFATYLPTQAVPAIAGFLVLPILARKLAPTDLGVLAIMQTLISFGWNLTGTWFANAIIRELPAHRARGELASFRATLTRGFALVGLAIAIFAGLLLLGSIPSSAIAQNWVPVVAAATGLVIQNIAVSLFAAGLRPAAYAAVEVTARIGGIGLGVALVFAGHGVSGYLAGLAFSSVVIGTVGLFFAWPRDDRDSADRTPTPSHIRAWLEYGIPVSLGGILLWGLAFVDRYILAALRDTADVGIYTMGNVLGDRLVMVPMFAFTVAATPLLVTSFERYGRGEVERLMTVYTRIVLLVALPSVAYVSIASASLVKLIAGSNYSIYREAATVAPIVAGGSLVFALAGLANTGLVVSKRSRYLAMSAGIGLVSNAVANAVLIPAYGIEGAAIATPLSMAVYLASNYWWSRRYATWRFPYSTLLRASVAASAGAYAAVFVPIGRDSSPVKAAVEAAVGLAVYVLVLLALGERRRHAAVRA